MVRFGISIQILGSISQKTYKKQDMVKEHRNTAVAF